MHPPNIRADADRQAAALRLLAKINAAVKAANDAEATVTTAQAELVSRSKTVGLLLLEAKKLHPAVKDFEAFLKKVQGLKLSRAYDLLRLAGGRTTDEELKKDARERQQKSRANKKKLPQPTPKKSEPPISVTVTESAEISIEQRRAENAALDILPDSAETKTKPDLFAAAKKSKQNLEWFAVACREYLPNITVEMHRKEARRLVAELTKAEAA
jgi:hypothetical protein